MIYSLVLTTQFKKDLKRITKRGYNIALLKNVIDALCMGEKLDSSFRDHALSGNYSGFRECHIKPDWLLVYAISGTDLILTASRTGSHADLFDE